MSSKAQVPYTDLRAVVQLASSFWMRRRLRKELAAEVKRCRNGGAACRHCR
jgi:hypothetical protein